MIRRAWVRSQIPRKICPAFRVATLDKPSRVKSSNVGSELEVSTEGSGSDSDHLTEMGVGGSTSRPNSATVIMSNKRPLSSSSDHSAIRESSGAHSSPPDNRPTNSCCSHYRENHSGVTRTVTPADPAQKDDSIDDEIEEIVANTLDLVSNQRTSRQPTPHLRDTDRGGGGGIVVRRDVTSSATSSGSGQRRLLQRSESTRKLQKRPSDEDSDNQYDAKVSTCYSACVCYD
ncbi:hypothetical protein AVEN_59705-1 [Araneus ventricosus]|uniref:Uncharacterized protein n=1 Tax=Araneus ventricosus TaxID=182803 RepID=A0A4Y2BQP8_ARAVE|nr:hypothetical protein AVEN_59705-1 [Araneus ventricosus]